MSDYFPVDVVVEILKRLPVKSLVRCRSVCKTWNSLITNPSFISTHLQTALSKPHTHLLLPWFFHQDPENYALHFYNDDYHDFNQLPFPVKGSSPYFVVVGSCNGLVFLRSSLIQCTSNFIFWNPSIHKYITLPDPSIDCTRDNYLIYGFGFDSRISDYKLLVAVVEKNEPLREAYLFSLNENSWKKVTAISPKYTVANEKPSTFVNGVAHWVGYQRGENGECMNTILGFVMSTEEFLMIGLPESLINFFPTHLSVRKYEGSSIAMFKSDWDNGVFDVWVMKEYGAVGSWTKVLHFTRQRGRIPWVLGFRKNAAVLLQRDSGEMASLDLKSQQIKHLGIKAAMESFVDSYVESLALLDKALDPCSELMQIKLKIQGETELDNQ